MKRHRVNYNETKDQSVPFALPALKSYKQNLLFPEGKSKNGPINDLSFDVLNNTISSPSKEKKRD